ncbi:MAG: hypothetical protein HFI93_08455 [Lachnospiraceae bacterium]|nr:hypothetical protein [Lachnospiraceae bacterium]
MSGIKSFWELFCLAGLALAECWDRVVLRRRGKDRRKKERLCSELFPGRSGKEALREHEAGRWGFLLLALGSSCLIGFFAGFQEPEGIVRTQLIRRAVGKGGQQYELQVRGLGTEEVPVQIRLREQVYSNPELLFEEAYNEALENLFQEGDTPDEVRHSLRFQGKLCQGVVKAEWDVGTSGFVRYDGVISEEQIPEEGNLIEIKLTLTYEDEKVVYPISLYLFPPEYTQEEQEKRQLMEALTEAEADSRTEAVFFLPKEFLGRKLTFIETADRVSPMQIMFLGFLIGLAGYWISGQRLEEKGKQRSVQMEMDYPEVVLKLAVLIRAGLTVRSAWERIAGGYENMRREARKSTRSVYEEMCQTNRRMQGGLSEAEAYREFGRRTHLHSYLRLSSLLEQNLKKGSRGLVQQLEAEVDEAWIQRKNLARQRGEEAGTRMLLPMLLMLVVVLLLIIIPAWMSL